jgi:transposase-like protein
LSRLNQLFNWNCPICQHRNTNDLYSNETERPSCLNCNEQCDVYLDIKISVREVVPKGKIESENKGGH